MPNIKSAAKMMRVNEKRRLRNRAAKSTVKTSVTKATRLIQGAQAEEAKTSVIQAICALDKAAQRGVIHKNNAARRKSRLMKKLNTAQIPSEG